MNFVQIPVLLDFDKDIDPKTIRSKKKVSLLSTFHVGSRIWDEKMSGSGMRKCWDPDPGLNIPNPQHCD
jgi:hypothetical protein